MDPRATAPEADRIRHGLGFLNMNDPRAGLGTSPAGEADPRRPPLSSPNAAMAAMKSTARGSVDSVPSPSDSNRTPSWSPDNWVPPDQSHGSPSSRKQSSPRVTRDQRPSTSRSISNSHNANVPLYSLYPAPNKPLPPLPPPKNSTARMSSGDSGSRSSISTNRSSRSSGPTSYPDYASVPTSAPVSPPVPRWSGPSSHADASADPYSTPSSPQVATPPPQAARHEQLAYRPPRRTTNVQRSASQRSAPAQLSLVFWKKIVSDDKKVNNSVYYLDLSPTASTLATKHGNNIVKVWSVAGGSLQSMIKFSSYTEAQSRSRDYLIRSHAILSETSTLIAIATRFGRSIEVWDWARKKCLQTIGDADRWTAGRVEVYDNGWSPLAIYRGDAAQIDLFLATREAKKPFFKQRTIELKNAGLPFVPQYPELALSATSPLLVVAAGPRPPIAGHPPPQRETLLVAWDTSDNGGASNKPYRVARPWQHTELDTAVPCDLVAYGSVIVSIWIPASFRAVPASGKGSGYNLTRVKVPFRYILVWDLSANSTRTIAIPNCPSCISPDCRLVAYCDASGSDIGARGNMTILDVITGEELWSWPDKNAINIASGTQSGFQQFDDLGNVTELAFAADGRFLTVGDSLGNTCVYDIRV
ncbi:hypothetical protein K4F52_006863 [Lecanicillium sp. MT-2017a]|nr:hypothetical protein K4F52_006863 [Lecanicillium sp. MT-2017a]